MKWKLKCTTYIYIYDKLSEFDDVWQVATTFDIPIPAGSSAFFNFLGSGVLWRRRRLVSFSGGIVAVQGVVGCEDSVDSTFFCGGIIGCWSTVFFDFLRWRGSLAERSWVVGRRRSSTFFDGGVLRRIRWVSRCERDESVGVREGVVGFRLWRKGNWV